MENEESIRRIFLVRNRSRSRDRNTFGFCTDANQGREGETGTSWLCIVQKD